MREADAIRSDVKALQSNVQDLESHFETADDALDNLPRDDEDPHFGGRLQETGRDVAELANELAETAEDLGDDLGEFHFSTEADEAGGDLADVAYGLKEVHRKFSLIQAHGKALKNDPTDEKTVEEVERNVGVARNDYEEATYMIKRALDGIPSQAELSEAFEEYEAARGEAMFNDAFDP